MGGSVIIRLLEWIGTSSILLLFCGSTIIRLLEWIWMSFIFIAILWKYDYKAAGMDMDEFYFLLLFDGSKL
nr:Piso0_005274 [bacterium]